MATVTVAGDGTPISVKLAATGAVIQNLGPNPISVGPNADPSADILLAAGGIITIDGGATLAAPQWFATSQGSGAKVRSVEG
jgi:hypothetical protein